ncbi:hypothetical protein HK097_009514 [Rhizophlyctis rosea]|uniref:Uncharacterized protein n=1 Tax=Rhizophlyctis rosea TaxID=64517 RepID=A0AAD5X3R4_9FUNG|nr:hypothetical protein HK097_009514 [Rhizophlyctis rosea]
MPAQLPLEQVHLADQDPTEFKERQERTKEVLNQQEEERKRLELETAAADARTDLLRTLSAIEADKQIEAERQRRIVEDKRIEAQEELLRKQNTHQAIQLEEQEQQRRVAEEKKAVVENDIVRVGKAREVNYLEDEEKQRRAAARSYDNLPQEDKELKKRVQESVVEEAHKKHPDESSYVLESQASSGSSHVPRSSQQQVGQQQGGGVGLGAESGQKVSTR